VLASTCRKTLRRRARPRVLDQRSNAFAKNQLIVALDKGILVVVLDENVISQLGAIVQKVAPSQRH
jgi:hypothetical protein